jgi:hypothetical protein
MKERHSSFCYISMTFSYRKSSILFYKSIYNPKTHGEEDKKNHRQHWDIAGYINSKNS